MARKRNIASGKSGIERSKHPGEMSRDEYSFMLNGNFQDEHGNGAVILQNEPSNVKCSGFKPGYKVIGHKFDINSDRTYFWLVNPSTGCSEIGYIGSFYKADSLEAIEKECNCDIQVVLENPLENIEQVSICQYNTLISDFCVSLGECSGCLNFNINYPIRENNIHIRRSRTGVEIFFTDFYNPQRYLKLDYLESYTQLVDDCDDTIMDTCLQCDKLRVFPLTNKPCLFPRIIQNGGNLAAGVYETVMAYSTLEGQELSDYYSITNPVPIHDKNNNILDQTNLDYLTNQSIGLSLYDLDTRYEYYKIVVIYRSGLDSSVTTYEYGVYPISTDRVSISSLKNKQRIDIGKIFQRRTVYTHARGFAVANNTLWQYGLKAHREVNLQPIVNLLGSFVRWSTVQANEDIYENGVYVSNYLSFMRDEVYPLGIKLYGEGGYESPLFPLIPRPPRPDEIEVLGSEDFPTNDNTNSVLANNPQCTENNRNQRWQFENTAQILGRCEIESTGYEEDIVQREVESSCYVKDESGDLVVVDTIVNSSIEITTNNNLVDYINTHIYEIIASTGPNGSDIRDILSDPTAYPEVCVPDFDDNCSEEIEIVKEEIFAIGVDVENTNIEDFDFGDYTRPVHPQNCNVYQLDENFNPIEDSIFMDSYMEASEIVYKRVANPTNTSCAAASIAPLFTDPQIDNISFLLNKGQIGSISILQGSLNVSATRTSYSIGLTGTSGTANIVVGGVNYLSTFNTSLTITASDFVIAHAASILTATGSVVTSVGPNILIIDTDSLSPTVSVVNLTGDLDGSADSVNFTNKLHTNAVWFKLNFNGSESTILELTSVNCAFGDDNSSSMLRISVFEECSETSDISTYSRIIDDMSAVNDSQKFIQFDASDFSGSTVYVAFDSPIRRRIIEDPLSPGVFIQSNTLTPPCGCFGVYQRNVETLTVVTYTNLTFGKKSTYKSLCDFVIPNLKGCDPIPYEYGLFSHWQSEDKYPCTSELFDSSNLVISDTDIPLSMRTEFEEYYVTGISGGQYILNLDTNFQDKPIRHYKFPDSRIVPFMSFNKTSENQDPGAFKPSMVYPIGFSLDNAAINAFLDIAVKNGLLSIEERSRFTRYEIMRGDRRTDKSVIAKGLLFDVYRYAEESGEYSYYPNYPLNSLGTDIYNGGVNHPQGSLSNNLFTFHSPETSFDKPTLPREMAIEGYQFGKAAHYFDEVKDHPKYVLLGDDAYGVATTLAIAEVAFELLLQSGQFFIDAAAAGTIAGVPLATGIAIGYTIALGLQGVFRVGEIRYKWLNTFINLGKPNNFAYFQTTIGHYGVFLPSLDIDQTLRGLSSVTYLRPGRFSVVDETTSDSLNVNNLDREDSVFLSLGSSNPQLVYPPTYVNYDNSSSNLANASRRGYNGTGRSPRLVSNAASPYVALKQYLPSQYGSIYSVEWINTGFCGDLNRDSQCDPIFGGDTYISRFSLKRKLPFFTTNAMDLASLTPFAYSDYFNVNPVEANRVSGYYLDYLINDDSNNFVSLFVFPTPRSKFVLDPIGLNQNVFYIKPPAKFYLFSYGIPYFLVESSVNCNFRYGKREAFENFYPNVGDVVDWTQEKNVSIKQPNTFFYNPVYSAEHSFYPWKMLPINYSQELFSKLDDLENSAIYSKEDNLETSLTNPWLLYQALDIVHFPKEFGKLLGLEGIESEQLLIRFTNGFSIFNAIDQIRERAGNPETPGLGNGALGGRTISFNKTELGYAGTQHTAMISCNFGRFWADAKRGQVFNVKPNGSGFDEITKGLDKWFKENLPFKILGNVIGLTDLDLDNSYKGLGIAMGWDDRLKRVFLTKKDYIPLSDDLNYQEGVGFYIAEVQDCPEGYTREGDYCVRETIVDPVPTSDVLELEPQGGAPHGFATPALYSQYNSDGSADVDGLSPTGFTYENLTDPFWTGNGVIADRFVVRLGKWVIGGSSDVWYGFSIQVEIPVGDTYYIAVAADNLFRISIDGVVILESDTDTMGPQHGLSAPQYATIPFRKVHIYPVNLEEGCRILKVEGLNEGGPALFAAAILDNTDQELRDATSMEDLNFIFSTETAEVFYEDALEYACPPNSEPIEGELCPKCLLTERIPYSDKITIIELDNTDYFQECSFTVAYSPLTERWISYYSFKPNYYISYHDYFQTGINYSSSENQVGLWSHFPFMSSYQVFYGVRYPWIIEYPLQTSFTNSILETVHYWLDVRKYYEKYNFANVPGYGFSKAFVYNDQQNSGQLNLVTQVDNDLRQHLIYPKYNIDSVDILQTEINGEWSFNYLYNMLKNERSGLPPWLYDCNQIEKGLNTKIFDYRSIMKDYLRGDYFSVRLVQDVESRFKMLFRFATDDRNFYEQ